MPLARIITRNPQDAVTASDYLRSLGYRVETVSPADFRVTPADLEINVEKCNARKALARVQAAVEARRPDARVTETPSPAELSPEQVSAPEVSTPSEPMTPAELELPAEAPTIPTSSDRQKIAIAYDITGRPVEFEQEAETPERRNAPNSLGRALVAMFSRAKSSIASRLAKSSVAVQRPVREFRRQRAEEHQLKLEAELAREQEEMREHEELARQRVQQDIEEQRLARERAARQQEERERQAQERRRLAEEKAAAEERERARIQAERAARLAEEQERARAEAERQAAIRAGQERTRAEREREDAIRAEQDQQQTLRAEQERLEAERDAARRAAEERGRIAAMHEAMIAAQRREAQAGQPHPAVTDTPAPPSRFQGSPDTGVAKAQPRQPRPSQPRRSGPFVVHRRRTSRAIPRKAIAAAAGIVLLFVLGIVAYANRRPASPLSLGALTRGASTQQQAPFGAATVTPPAPVAAPKPSPAVPPATAQKRTSPARPAAHRNARRLRRAPHTRKEEDDAVAEDEVVVRHFQTQRPRQQPTTSSAKLKRYSDMD